MSLIVKLKNNIRKYIRNYVAFACSLLMLPIFSVNAFAYTSYDTFYLDSTLLFQCINGSSISSVSVSSDSNNLYTINDTSSANAINIYIEPGMPFTYPVNTDIFNYYFLASFYSTVPQNSINYFTFFPTSFDIFASNHNDSLDNVPVSNLSFYHTDSNYSKGFSVSGQLDITDNNGFTVISCQSPSVGTLPEPLYFEFVVFALPKSMTAGDANQAIVNAINSQTSQLSGQLGDIDSGIDKGNDLIENGNEDTQSAVSDFNEVFEDFNNELDTWEQFDDDIIGEFNNANDNYMAELDNFSLSGSLLNAGTWLSTSMQTVYDNSSDYKMLWLVPLLFGIPILLFIIRKNGDDE